MKKYDDFLTESDFHATKAKYLSRPMNAIAEPFAMWDGSFFLLQYC